MSPLDNASKHVTLGTISKHVTKPWYDRNFDRIPVRSSSYKMLKALTESRCSTASIMDGSLDVPQDHVSLHGILLHAWVFKVMLWNRMTVWLQTSTFLHMLTFFASYTPRSISERLVSCMHSNCSNAYNNDFCCVIISPLITVIIFIIVSSVSLMLHC